MIQQGRSFAAIARLPFRAHAQLVVFYGMAFILAFSIPAEHARQVELAYWRARP